MSWYDSSGRRLHDVGTTGQWGVFRPALAKDGMSLVGGGNNGHHFVDLEHPTLPTRLNTAADDCFTASEILPGNRHVLLGGLSDSPGVYYVGTGVTDEPVRILETERRIGHPIFLGDSLIAYVDTHPTTGRDIMAIWAHYDSTAVIRDAGEPFPLIANEAQVSNPEPHPRLPLLAYTSDESGPWRVYVRSFSVNRDVFNENGTSPIWSLDGTRLFYVSNDNWMMEADVSANTSVPIGQPRQLFHLGEDFYDVGGQFESNFIYDDRTDRFLISRYIDPIPTPELIVIENWEELLKRQ